MKTSDDLKERIEAIESGYEFMLAYAAQGRHTDKGAAAGRNVREYLDKMVAALEGLSPVVDACAKGVDPELSKKGAAFFAAVDTDADVVGGRAERADGVVGDGVVDGVIAESGSGHEVDAVVAAGAVRGD